ncbi:MAG TPA: AraC family transcriptional regulator [Gemmatimonadaceae bacterium]|nr:AraC family transcriptional regulator [Gemmatimonadaceae bacterium]
MHRCTVLLRTPMVSLSLLECSGRLGEDVTGEGTEDDAIAFGETVGTLHVMPRGSMYACGLNSGHARHRLLSVAYSREAVDALRATGLPSLRPGNGDLTIRQRFLRRRLQRLAAMPTGDRALTLELVGEALFASVTAADEAASPWPAVSNAAMGRIADAAELIETQYSRPLSLTQLAEAAGMSPYHFARTFRNLVGVPPHRYLVSVRLREAVRRIEQGEAVTMVCYNVGFSSPSHFTAAFRQHVGVLPSRLRHACRKERAS